MVYIILPIYFNNNHEKESIIQSRLDNSGQHDRAFDHRFSDPAIFGTIKIIGRDTAKNPIIF
jgi:hypothetical protein